MSLNWHHVCMRQKCNVLFRGMYVHLPIAERFRLFHAVRWRSVWSWSSRFPTAHTRSWPPVCRASRAWTWTRSQSGRPRWAAAQTQKQPNNMQTQLTANKWLIATDKCYSLCVDSGCFCAEEASSHNSSTMYGGWGGCAGRRVSTGVRAHTHTHRHTLKWTIIGIIFDYP